jgi:hypothetical protein
MICKSEWIMICRAFKDFILIHYDLQSTNQFDWSLKSFDRSVDDVTRTGNSHEIFLKKKSLKNLLCSYFSLFLRERDVTSYALRSYLYHVMH